MFQNYMLSALEAAQSAYDLCEIPVGAVIIYQHKILCMGHNLVRTHNDPTAHAEIVVLRKAAQILGNYRLSDCDLYVTLEPCAMCAGAIAQARIRRLYFGAYDPKGGAVTSGITFFNQPSCHHHPEIYDGIQENQCAALLKDFFS